MGSNLPKVITRTDAITIEKLKVISKENGRSVSKEIEMLIKNHIKRYELDNGEIKIEEK